MAIGSHLKNALKRLWLRFWHQSSAVVSETMALAPLDESSVPPKKIWALAETTNANNEKNILLVEVESFSQINALPSLGLDYTVAGEDPNLRITHYPPSHLLH